MTCSGSPYPTGIRRKTSNVGGATKNAGADPAEIPVDERTDGPGVSRIDPDDPPHLLEGAVLQTSCVLGNDGLQPLSTRAPEKSRCSPSLDLQTRDAALRAKLESRIG